MTQDTPLASAWLAAIVESAEDAIISKNLDGIISSWNPSAERIFGYPAAEAIGRHITLIIPEDRRGEETTIITAVRRGERIQHFETVRVNRDGSDLYISLTVSPIKAPDGKIIGVSKIARDVSRSKQAAERQRKAEERYRALTEATATTVWHADPEGGLTFVGDVWSEVSGQTKEHILQDGWLDAVHPDDRARTLERWQQSLESKTFYAAEFRVMTVAGEYRWFAASAVPILSDDGSVLEWIGSNIDIDSRKRAEEERTQMLSELESQRARLVYIFDKAPAFVAVLEGADHTYELTNPAYERHIGHRELIGKTIRETLPELVGQGYFELLDQVYETGEPFIGNELPVSFQYAADRPLETRFVDFVFQPIFGKENKATGIFVHGVDVTEQVEARQQAESANQLKDEFLATLSHELRTPLNAVLGWSQMLRTKNLDEKQRENAILTIERNARVQNQLIDDVLDVSRIITGKLRLDVRAVDLPKVITTAVESLRPAVEARNIKLQMLLDPQAGPISGDPDRLQQVIWNLLSNAVKFTPKEGRIQIRLERINSHVEITVSDTGKGIEAEFLPYVFDRFRQSDGSSTRRQGGLGLGLAIVRQLVELHGGSVSVGSEGPDQGTTFTVALPLMPVRREPASEVAPARPAAETDVPIESEAELSGLHILVVDDELDSREVLKLTLEFYGAIALMAGSANEALEKLRQERFDVIISDIGMPEEDGYSLISRIRELPANEGGTTPAIALTAYARADDRVQALRSGFQLHIAKPVEHAELLAAIANLIDRPMRGKLMDC